MMYTVYILRSEKDGRLYKGCTSRLDERLDEHNRGKTKSTKGYRPWKLIYKEEFDSLDEALGREKFFKTGAGREYLERLINKLAP